MKRITKKAMRNMAEQIMTWISERDLGDMVNLYVNGKQWRLEKTKEGYHPINLENGVIIYESDADYDAEVQVEYANNKTITMTYEGPLYDEINYGPDRFTEFLNNLGREYGLYVEHGHAWSLALFKI